MKLLQNSRTSVRMLAAFAAAIFTFGFGLASARASIWQMQDDMEINPAATWRFEQSGHTNGLFVTDGLGLGRNSRSGQTGGYITAGAGAWIGVGRTVSFTPFFVGRTLRSVAGIYLRPRGTNVRVTLEVIDPVTWTYVSLKTVTLANSFTWQLVTTNQFIPYRKEVYVRISMGVTQGLQLAVDLDDLVVQAVY